MPFVRADAWEAAQPESRWERITVRGGEKGPLVVDAMTARVRAKQDGRIGPEERLVVTRPVGEPRIDYALTDADPEVPLAEVVRAQRQRHRIEEMFAAGNGEAGLDHYEVRSWVGWHHHMTLSLVALWFLCLERRYVGGEKPRRSQCRSRGTSWPGCSATRPPSPGEIARVATRVLRRNERRRGSNTQTRFRYSWTERLRVASRRKRNRKAHLGFLQSGL